VLSLLSTNTLHGKVEGINQLQAQDVKKYGPGNYIPNLAVTYWTFRLMIGAGILMIVLSLAGLVLQRRGRIERSRWFHWAAIVGILLPVLANWTGWIFTEIGRQPWVVYGLLKTSDARSPNVTSADVIITLGGFIVVFAILTAVGGYLMLREAKHGPDDGSSTGGDGTSTPDTAPDLVLAY
jgi:cytochrome d ubiquinol oxidase subunit I